MSTFTFIAHLLPSEYVKREAGFRSDINILVAMVAGNVPLHQVACLAQCHGTILAYCSVADGYAQTSVMLRKDLVLLRRDVLFVVY